MHIVLVRLKYSFGNKLIIFSVMKSMYNNFDSYFQQGKKQQERKCWRKKREFLKV